MLPASLIHTYISVINCDAGDFGGRLLDVWRWQDGYGVVDGNREIVLLSTLENLTPQPGTHDEGSYEQCHTHCPITLGHRWCCGERHSKVNGI